MLLALPAGCSLDGGSDSESSAQEPQTGEAVAQESAAVTIPSGHGIAPILGSGWDTSQEKVYMPCMESTHPRLLPPGSSNVELAISMDSRSATDALGFSAEVKAHYGLYDGSVAANFASSLQADDFSKTFIYRAEYFAPSQQLDVSNHDTYRLTAIGEAAQQNLAWAASCGDEGVFQVDYSGRFFLTFKLEFKNRESKQEFDAKISGSAPFGSIKAELETNHELYEKSVKLHVSAYQQGGDPTLISQIFTGIPRQPGDTQTSDGNVRAALECNLATLDQCEKFMSNATIYAADTQAGFPHQLNTAGFSATSYHTQPWSMFQVPTPPSIVTLALRDARNGLLALYDRNGLLLRRVSALLNDFPSTDDAEALNQWKTKLTNQNQRIMAGVKMCYDDITQRHIPNPTDDPDLTRTVADCVTNVSNMQSPAPVGLDFPPDVLLDSYGKEKPLVKAWVNMGGKDSVIGRPTEAAQDIPNGGIFRRYESGSLCYHIDTGVQMVRGEINQALDNRLLKFLNCPTGAPTAGGLHQEFQGGSIDINSATNVATISLKKIEFKVAAVGAGALGNRMGPLVFLAPNSVGQRFANGAIYLTPGSNNGGTAFLMTLANFDKLASLPAATQISIGVPVQDDATKYPQSWSPHFTRLQNGAVIEKPSNHVSTYLPSDDFFTVWYDKEGGPGRSDPATYSGGQVVQFDFNAIMGKPGVGAFDVNVLIYNYIMGNLTIARCGYPTSPLLPSGVGRQTQTFEHGTFTIVTVNHGGGHTTTSLDPVASHCP